MEKQGILETITECFDNEASAGALLAKSGVKKAFFPPFGTPNLDGWWREVCKKLELGMGGESSLENLLKSAADIYPGNKKFQGFRETTSLPENRNNRGGNITLKFPELSTEESIKVLDKVKEMAMETGGDINISFGRHGSSLFSLSITGVESQEEIENLTRRIERELAEEGYKGSVQVEPYHFRDYYSDPITAEGPDGQRYSLDRMPASTRVKDIARGVMHQYSDDVWPSQQGQKTQAIVDQVTEGGQSKRLDPRDTLHDAGVRPGDTLRVAPERTAGAIDPLMREAALARVKNEVLKFAEAHPGFEVDANSLVAPTEYIFWFSTRGFAPPFSPGGPPRPIDEHEVLVELPGDFPIEAPRAWWQTDIFHPNIDFNTGWVCLGALQEHYRPSLDFGELCQMLFDLAGFRNYAVTEGHNKDAAKWALSPEGQQAIEAIGGLSVIGRMVMEGAPEQKLNIRKI